MSNRKNKKRKVNGFKFKDVMKLEIVSNTKSNKKSTKILQTFLKYT